MTSARKVFLVTESPTPSGVGEHMLTLGAGLAADSEVVIAAPRGTALLRQARAAGFPVKAIEPGDEASLSRWLAQTRPALVHVHAGIGWEGHASARAARQAGAAVVRTEHLPYLLTDPAQRRDHAEGLKSVLRVICVSDAVRSSHRQAGLADAPLVTVANGVRRREPSRPRAELRREWALDDRPVLLMAGRFAEQKGHRLLLDALPRILGARADTIVLLAGDGPLLLDIAREVAGRGLAPWVRMLGARADMADLMAAADLLVLPSHFEGLALVALEAMAAGLPVVASDAAGNAEMIDDGRTGWLAASGSAEALAEAVLGALDDPGRLAEVAFAAAERQAERFEADRMVAETARIYDEALDEATKHQEGSMVRTRIGFIGAGGIAHRHFGILEEFEDVEIVAIADVDEARAAQAAERFGARSFAEAGHMIETVDLDAVYICVPPFAHGEPERAAIARGLPFFVEKPVALDLPLAREIAAAAAAAGLVTAVGYHWRYLDTVDEVRTILSTTPARLMSGYWLDATPPPRWWWHKDGSGGQMVEQTTHLLDLARYLGGAVESVYGLAGHTERAEFPGLDVATVSTASLRFASGAIANFASTCLLGWNHRVGLHLFGERLAIELTDHDVMIDVGRGRPVRGAEGDPARRQNRDFIDAVQGRENRIRCTYGDALATLELALAVVESAAGGMPVRLETA